tara:strand:+ start:1083 stop:1829 length:747 start_codon:yes stop_codon:yes gene_type:complete
MLSPLKLSAVIIDDEPKGRQTLNSYLDLYCDDVKLLGDADSVISGAKLINKTKPDLVFLDIMMGDGTGFELLERCQNLDFSVIFVTAHEEYALKAFKYSAVDFLLKPIDEDLLIQAVDKTNKSKDSNSLSARLDTLLSNQKQLKKLAIPTINSVEIVHVEDIIRLEADGNYTSIFIDNNKITSSKTLKEFDQILSGSTFFRIHKSHLVNLDKVVRYIQGDGGTVITEDGSEIEVARRRKESFLATLFN